MEKIYSKILKQATPYYEKGRIYALDEIHWMLKQATLLSEHLDFDPRILFPLIILHDVGYAHVESNNPHIKDQESKRIHLGEGVKIAQKILAKVQYDPILTEKILHFISVHDNWAFGDDEPYKQSTLLSLFNDLDFLYAQSSFSAFKYHGDSMGLPISDWYDFWMNDEKLTRRPFCCKQTKKLFETQMAERKKDIAQLA